MVADTLRIEEDMQIRVPSAKDRRSGKNLVNWGTGTQGDDFMGHRKSVPAHINHWCSQFTLLL